MSPPAIGAAIVGCGGIASLWADALSSNTGVEIAAVVDVRVDAAKQFAERHALDSPIFTDLDGALSSADVDVVCNITPPEVHELVDVTALTAGCHVFTEKPLAPSVAAARRIQAAAGASGRRVSVMQNRRFDAHARALASFVASGALGRPAIVSIDFFMGIDFGGFRQQMDHPLLLDMAIHHFDQARQFSPVPVSRVSCVEMNPEGSPYRGNAVAVGTFERADGSLVSFRGSWATPGMPTPWAGTWRVSGPKGTATWDGDRGLRAQVVGADGRITPVEVVVDDRARSGHAGCIDEMVAALAEDRPAETDIADNLESLAMVEAAVESARHGGQPVEVEH